MLVIMKEPTVSINDGWRETSTGDWREERFWQRVPEGWRLIFGPCPDCRVVDGCNCI